MAQDWGSNGDFMKKPATGWIHDDDYLSSEAGVYYPVKYLGFIKLARSMRELQSSDLNVVTREAITLCAEAAGAKKEHRRQVKNVVRQYLTEDPQSCVLDINLHISTAGTSLVQEDGDGVIASHMLNNLSFATGMESEDYEILGYVAKDHQNMRACHVFDAGLMAPDVISTISQALELRYKAHKAKSKIPNLITESTYGDASIYGKSGVKASIYGDDTYGQTGMSNPALYGQTGMSNPALYGQTGGGNNANANGIYGQTGVNSNEALYDTADSGVNPGFVTEGLYDKPPVPTFSNEGLYGDDTNNPSYGQSGYGQSKQGSEIYDEV
eukprot:m.155595 g.155595  ORF g.155595 m.155595 type:complete len:326 (-) comp30941_c0_seq1:84-1061(-)